MLYVWEPGAEVADGDLHAGDLVGQVVDPRRLGIDARRLGVDLSSQPGPLRVDAGAEPGRVWSAEAHRGAADDDDRPDQR